MGKSARRRPELHSELRDETALNVFGMLECNILANPDTMSTSLKRTASNAFSESADHVQLQVAPVNESDSNPSLNVHIANLLAKYEALEASQAKLNKYETDGDPDAVAKLNGQAAVHAYRMKHDSDVDCNNLEDFKSQYPGIIIPSYKERQEHKAQYDKIALSSAWECYNKGPDIRPIKYTKEQVIKHRMAKGYDVQFLVATA